jgi:murein DD-endopeptidase MepM/ murein hydrolase activator NlpD
MPKIRITGRLPKADLGLENNNNCAPDEYWDGTKCVKIRPYEQIFDTEFTVGGYDPSGNKAYGLSNYGYNNRRGFYQDDKGVTIDARTGKPAVNYTAPNPTDYDSWYKLFNTEYGKDLEQFNPGIRTEAGDLLYNAGVDPRIYMLDQYVRNFENNTSGLTGRGDFRKANKAGVWTDPTKEADFNKIYNQYKSKIDALSPDQQLNLINKGREFFYTNTNRGYYKDEKNKTGFVVDPNNPKEINPASLSWLQRYGMPNYSGKFKPTANVAQQPVVNTTTTTTAAPIATVTNPVVTNSDPAKVVDSTKVTDPIISNQPVSKPEDKSTAPSFDGFKLDVAGIRNDISNMAPPEEIGAEPDKPKPPVNPFSEFGMTPFAGMTPFKKLEDEDNERNEWSKRKRKRFDRSLIGMQDTPEQKLKYADWYNQQYPQSKFMKGLSGFTGAVNKIVNQNILPIGGAYAAFFQNEKAKKDAEKRAREAIYNQSSEPKYRGDYTVNEGDFRPNEYVVNKGMYTDNMPGLRYGKTGGTYYAEGGPVIEGSIEENAPDLISLKDVVVGGKSPSTFSTTSFTEGDRSTSSNILTSDAYVLPLKNFTLTSGYGQRKAPKKGASTFHNGLDLAVPVDSDVYSPMDGVVKSIGYNSLGGNQLIIEHPDGSRSGFSHLNSYKVKVGDNIVKGQVVALSGNTGNSTGPHLHYTYRDVNGDPIDPRLVFDFGGGTRKAKKQTGGLGSQVSLTHNNPLNVHYGEFARRYNGVIGSKDGGGNVAVFPDLETGIKANMDLLFGPAYNTLSIAEARNKWVNGNANEPTESTSYIVKDMGGNKPMSQLTAEEKDRLFKLFAKWEGSQAYNKIKNMRLYKEGGQIDSYNEGDEYELTEDEIKEILANGGDVEFI